jgi:inner membrane protein involved in colicin E2 resistance
MPLGRWESAIVKSILIVGAVSACVIAFNYGLSLTLSGLHELISFLGLFALVYLVVSAAGWLLIGLPVHWVICKYTKGSYFTYIAAALSIDSIIWLLLGFEAAIFFGIAILFQVVVFRYYVSHNKTESSKSGC